MLHHPGIGVQGGEGLGVVVAEGAEDEAAGLELGEGRGHRVRTVGAHPYYFVGASRS